MKLLQKCWLQETRRRYDKHYADKGYLEKNYTWHIRNGQKPAIITTWYMAHKTWNEGNKLYPAGPHIQPTQFKFNENHLNTLAHVTLSPNCRKAFSEPLLRAHRRNRNLQDTLVRANLLKSVQTEKDRSFRRNKSVTLQLQMVSWSKVNKLNHVYHHWPYFLWPRKHCRVNFQAKWDTIHCQQKIYEQLWLPRVRFLW